MSFAGYSDQEVVDAMVRANRDRAFLASLRMSGKVTRSDSSWSDRNSGFVRLIEGLARPTREINLAIRAKKRRKR